MYLFRVFGKGEVAKTREQRTKLRKRGLKRGKGGKKGSENSGKEGENMGESEKRQLPCLKLEKEREKCKICPY